MGHWTVINALIYLLVRFMKKPYVVCPAGALPIYGRSKRLKRFYNHIIGGRIVRNADGHVAITVDELPQFESYGISADRVAVIPNGVSSEDFQSRDDRRFRAEHGLGEDPFVLFMGRLNPIKGPDLLLKAFCSARDELHHYHLVFAGSDEGMLLALKQTATECGVQDRVHFVGHLGREEKSWAYHAASLLAIPSRQEAMSLVVLEAGITGTPVLITDKCGFGQVSEAGGGLVVPASVEGLRTGLLELLGDPGELKVMGARLQKFVASRFTWDLVVEEYLELYGRILKSKGRG